MKTELRLALIPDVPCHHGAPMRRANFWDGPTVRRSREGDVKIPINLSGYDAGGAYWGVGAELRCRYRFELVDSRWVLTGREFYRGVRRSKGSVMVRLQFREGKFYA
jgi:hypothetical protein